MWVEQLPNGKYKFVERYMDPMTGKQKKISVTLEKDTSSSRKIAQKNLQERIDKACYIVERDKITFGELIEAYRVDQKKTVRASTYTRNYHASNSLMEILGKDIIVSNISAPFIREKFLATDDNAHTLNERLRRLKAILRWGYRNDYISDVSYLDKVTNFKYNPERELIESKYLESDELKLLINSMRHRQWKMLTQFLVFSGLRIGEAIALEKKDVDFKAKKIYVTKAYDSVNELLSYTKNSPSIREIDMQPELEKVCKEIISDMNRKRLKKNISTDLFMFDDKGEYIRYYTYNKYLRENTLKYIGRTLTPHTLRHTHASLLMENGVPIDVISRRLGHGDNSKVTKEIYLHVTKKLKEKDAEIIMAVSFI